LRRVGLRNGKAGQASPGHARRFIAALGAALSLSVAAAEARADDDEADGVYGRFEGDLDLRVGAGMALAKGGPSLAASASLLYISSAGLYVHYADALGGEGPAVVRSIAAGLVIEPLFVARYALDLQHGPARLDLLLDSIALQMGAFWDVPRGGAFAHSPGFELALGFGIPIFKTATGPVLGVRGALRFGAPALSGAEGGSVIDKGALLSITLSWRQILQANIIDAADRAQR
jgi:hypothetical protein